MESGMNGVGVLPGAGSREEDYPSEYGRPHAAIGFSLVIWYGMKEDGLLWVWVVEKMDELGDRTP
jgi:hypothetical protein